MPPTGKGRLGILVVAEAPGKTEDERGIQLIGQAGQVLRQSLRRLGVDLDRDCWKTNAIICRPPKNATPSAKQINFCRPNLVNTIKKFKPRVIILLGAAAVKSLLSIYWHENIGTVSRWVGWRIPLHELGCWICPTYHPSYILRERGKETEKVLQKFFTLHLKNAINSGPLPLKRQYNLLCCERSEEAVELVEGFIQAGKAVSFDYETNCLKPDSDKAQILCCAVSDGETSASFPWNGATVATMAVLLQSPIPKIGANLKFEQRWTKRQFGFGVRNWHWDVVQAAHILDNRSAVSGVKFQSFVRFGIPSYDDEISKFLKADSARSLNRIHEVPMDQLLKYNAMDAGIEYSLAELQMQEFGIDLEGNRLGKLRMKSDSK